MLRLDVNLVVFIEPKGATFVRQARQGRESRTAVIESRLDDLPCYKDLERVTEIMKSERFRAENINWKMGKVAALAISHNMYITVNRLLLTGQSSSASLIAGDSEISKDGA